MLANALSEKESTFPTSLDIHLNNLMSQQMFPNIKNAVDPCGFSFYVPKLKGTWTVWCDDSTGEVGCLAKTLGPMLCESKTETN